MQLSPAIPLRPVHTGRWSLAQSTKSIPGGRRAHRGGRTQCWPASGTNVRSGDATESSRQMSAGCWLTGPGKAAGVEPLRPSVGPCAVCPQRPRHRALGLLCAPRL